MKSKLLWWAATAVAVLALAAGIRTLAEDETPGHFSGVINDYAPAGNGSNGPMTWELRGPWTLRINKEKGTANFSAAITMELSPVNQSSTSIAGVALTQHTHQIAMRGATVNYNASDCPVPASIIPIPRIEVTGMAIVAANGGPFPPSSSTAVPSQLQVCIDGGTLLGTVVKYSNITLAFGAPASGHFGLQPIHGVVVKASSLDD